MQYNTDASPRGVPTPTGTSSAPAAAPAAVAALGGMPARRQDPQPAPPAAAAAPTPTPAPAPAAAPAPAPAAPGADNPDDVTDDTGPDSPSRPFIPYPAAGSSSSNPLVTLHNGTVVNAYDHWPMSAWAPLCANGTIPDCPLGIPMPVLEHLLGLGAWFATAIFGLPVLALLWWGLVGRWRWTRAWAGEEERRVEERKRRWAAREAHRRAAKAWGGGGAHRAQHGRTQGPDDTPSSSASAYPPPPPPPLRHPSPAPVGPRSARHAAAQPKPRRPQTQTLLPSITSSVRASVALDGRSTSTSTYVGSTRRSAYGLLNPVPLRDHRNQHRSGDAGAASPSDAQARAPLLVRNGLPSPSPSPSLSLASPMALLSPAQTPFGGGRTPLSPFSDAYAQAVTPGAGSGSSFPWFEGSPGGTSYDTSTPVRGVDGDGDGDTDRSLEQRGAGFTSRTSLIEHPHAHTHMRQPAASTAAAAAHAAAHEEAYDDFDVSLPSLSSSSDMDMSSGEIVDPYAQTPASTLRVGFGVGAGVGVGAGTGTGTGTGKGTGTAPRRPRLSSAPRFSLRPARLQLPHLPLGRGGYGTGARSAVAAGVGAGAGAFAPIAGEGEGEGEGEPPSPTAPLSLVRPQPLRGSVAIDVDVPDNPGAAADGGVQGRYRGRRQSRLFDVAGMPSLDLAAMQGNVLLNLNVSRRRPAGPRRGSQVAHAQVEDPLSPFVLADAPATEATSPSPFVQVYTPRQSGYSSVSASAGACSPTSRDSSASLTEGSHRDRDSQTRDLLADPRAWAPARQGGGGRTTTGAGTAIGPTWGEAIQRESALASLAGAVAGAGAGDTRRTRAAGVRDKGRRAGLVLDKLQVGAALYLAPPALSPLDYAAAVDEKDPSALALLSGEKEKPAPAPFFAQSKGLFSSSTVTLGANEGESTPPSTSSASYAADPFSPRPGGGGDKHTTARGGGGGATTARASATAGNCASLRPPGGYTPLNPSVSEKEERLATLLSDELHFIASSPHAADWGWRWRAGGKGFADPMGLPSVVPGSGGGGGAGGNTAAQRSSTKTTTSTTTTTYWRSTDTPQGHWKFAQVSRFAKGLDGVGLGALASALRHIPTSSGAGAGLASSGSGDGNETETDLAELDVDVRKRIEEWFGNGESGPFFR